MRWLEKKNKLVLEGREQHKIVTKEQEKLNKIGLQIQKYKDKIIPLVKKVQEDQREKGMLGEFEEYQSVEIENDEVVITTFDAVEEYKNKIREQRNEQSNGDNNESKGDAS